MSLSVEALQLESAAPKRLVTVRPPVEEALVKLRMVVVRLFEVNEDAVVVARVDVPETFKSKDARVFDVSEVAVVVAKYEEPETVRLVVEAFVSVVFPVTSSVEENVPVVPVIAPSDETRA